MNKGFSLIELLIAVAILGVVTAIAIPTYTDYISTAKANSAKQLLRTIYLSQQEYFTENNSYYSTGATCGDAASSINTNLFAGKNVIDDDNYTYCITQSTTSDFTATANEAGGTNSFTIDQDNVTNF